MAAESIPQVISIPPTTESSSSSSSSSAPVRSVEVRRGRWALERGARVLPDGSVRFSVWAPQASRVTVRILGGAAKGEHPLAAVAHPAGVFEGVVAHAFDPRGPVDYVYLLDDAMDRPLSDPVSRWLPEGVHGPSRVVDPDAFRWTDDGWRGVAMRDLAIYELHVGTFSEEGTFDGVTRRLPELRALGVTAIEIMPVAQFPGTRNWGYDGVSLYAVQESYGGPEGLRRLVNAAHAEGLAVILDVVYNHLGPEGSYLDIFGPYHTKKYTTPWGPALNYDDAHSDEVRRYVIENALHWVTEYHVDGLRLDAVHGIFDFGATHLLQELAEAVHVQAARLGRTVVVIGESDLNDPRLLRAPEDHGYGLDGQWSDDFHHAVHAALTGENSGYYADYGGVSPVARSLEEPFVFAGDYSTHRKRRHGAPSVGIPREKFVVAVQNHDQVGNRAAGDRLTTMLSVEQQRLAAALLLLSPYVPLLFMGEEYGETNPFQYFVSHGDQQLVDAVRDGRRKEFEAFGWGEEVPDPQSEETFRRSRLDHAKKGRAPHAQLLALYRELLALRREEPALRPDGAELSVAHDAAAGWVTVLRRGGLHRESGRRASDRRQRGAAFLAIFNCSPTERDVPLPGESSTTAHEGWRLRLSTDAGSYGGRDRAPAVVRRGAAGDGRGVVRLPAWSAALYEGEPSAAGERGAGA